MIFTVLSLVVFDKSTIATIPQSERDALIAIYNSLGGPNWTHNDNWLGPEGTEGQWYGVSLNEDDTHVVGLQLSNNCLSEAIPAEIGNLTYLSGCYLDNNSIEGNIPLEIGNLQNLISLFLEGNSMKGEVPNEIADLQIPPCTGSIFLFSLAKNALFSNDDTVSAYLSERDCFCLGNFRYCQTLAPIGLAGGTYGEVPIRLIWAPILYQGDPGYYEIYYKPSDGDEYQYYGSTEDKSTSFKDIEGLEPGKDYCFKVRTVTYPVSCENTPFCIPNKNLVSSDFSDAICATVVVPPQIGSVSTMKDPFRLKIKGRKFHQSARVKIDGMEVSETKWKDDITIIAKGGKALKNLIPRGVTVEITVTNVDDNGTSAPFEFTR